ncbi:hypothetical protein SEA_BAUER_79 [Arthrobacter phage Bauer]|uniref:Uncharacterized protein n=1 Tax=Arthrobacter phage Bauer TaxID=2985648 RepID=A0A9E8A9W5_9CAUD|nr:hypothetical protein QEO99_gp79 [Arthrobacter phage Bauer]UYM26628.1 hypothetical protein SEA_BAUER_79 [Arthrobacter phage Bauer]
MSAYTSPRITSTASMDVPGSLTAGALRDFAGSVPPEARVSIKEHRGDQRDPGYVTLTASWEGGPSKPPTHRSSSLTAQRDGQ